MDRIFTRVVGKLSAFFLLLFSSLLAHAQTVTIRNVNPGPYGQGSTIAAEINVADNSGCTGLNNKYNLYLSDANGNFTSTTPIGTYQGFFTGFVNGIIPANTPAGTGYRLRVQTTSPVKTSDASAPFTINAVTGVQAAAASSSTSSSSTDVFGACVGYEGNKFTFTSPLASSNTVTASFYNDMTQQQEATDKAFSPSMQFTAKASSYTMIVKAKNADGIVGTKGYLLINNIININFGAQNSGSKCLGPNGADVSFNVDIQTDAGIQHNYPGSLYTVVWGDGSSQTLTYCQIKAIAGKLDHNYKNSSCGAKNAQGSITNQFVVRFSVSNPWCPPASSTDNPNTITTSQSIVSPPKNDFQNDARACINTEVKFTNTSDPGQTTNTGAGKDCTFTNARYSWYVDNDPNPKASGYTKDQVFLWTFTTPGKHTVRLSLENNQSPCAPDDAVHDICIETPAKAEFTLPGTLCISGGPVSPTDKSSLYTACDAAFKYTWTVTPSTGVTYAGGTNANSPIPQFVFSQAGKYNVGLTIEGPACGPAIAAPQTILVNSAPSATLSPDFSLCGKDHTLTFDNTDGTMTKTILTGTALPDGTTFQWTVTALDGQAPATFVNGTSATSEYPQISFPAFGKYEVKVSHANPCGPTVSDSQTITFLEAPTVNAGSDQIICQNDIVTLAADPIQYPVKWSGGAGTFSNPTSVNTTYTPTAAERAAGKVHLVLTATTTLPGDCSKIQDELDVIINPANTITSTNTAAICTGTTFNYTPTSSVSGSTFTWIATGSANATGYTATGTGNISVALTNTSATDNATVTYIITPHANNCDGTPFTLTVTVKPKPVITLTPASSAICSGQSSGISLQTNVSGTQYIWTVTTVGTVTGATGQTTPVAATNINQVLTNTGTAAATVTYTVTPVNSGTAESCTGEPKQVTITVQPATPLATAGDNKTVCNQTSYQLQGNNPTPFTGIWTSSLPGVTFSDATQYNTTVNGLQPGKTYVFTWTINGFSPCSPSFAQVTITNNAPITNFDIVTPNPSLTCSGNTISIIGKDALGGNNNPKYVWESSINNGANWTAVANQTARDLKNVQVFDNIRFRRTVTAGACTEISNEVSITVQPPVTHNTITPVLPSICTGTTAQINGEVPSGADGDASHYTYQWQTRANNNAAWQNITVATQQNYTTPVLTASAQYRRLVGSTYCQVSESTPVTIVVNPDAKAEFTVAKLTGCVPFTIDAQNVKAVQYPDRNDVYSWYANGQLIGTGTAFPGYTINSPGQSVQISLKVTSKNGCKIAEAAAQTFTTTDQFTLDFTANQPIVNNTITVCGTTAITFTNTSTPLSNATYSWAFGGATPATSTVAQPGTITFTANAPGGDDKVYLVTLNANPTCGIAQPKTIKVIVTSGKPLPIVDASKKLGCGTLTTDINNLTNGTNKSYQIYVENAATKQRVITLPAVTDKSSQSITLTEIGEYNIYMIATSLCDVQVTSAPVPVKVLPSNLSSILQVADDQKTEDCAPLTVAFKNLSQNVTSYWYDWGDGSHSEVFSNNSNSIPGIQHTYTEAGTYHPTVHSSNTCTIDQVSTDAITIVAYGRPKPDFTSTNTESQNCYTCSVVNFKNNTPDPNGNITYTWDFGDGSTSHDLNPNHNYDYNKGSTYTVKLTAVNINGCDASVTHTITIQEPASTLFLPNAFIPSNINPELRTFTAKGSGMSAWHMRIFNNYGQLIWETDKLDSRGAPTEGWDGTYKGAPVPQGVYIWQIDASFYNGQQWKGMTYNNSSPKRTGAINLIR